MVMMARQLSDLSDHQKSASHDQRPMTAVLSRRPLSRAAQASALQRDGSRLASDGDFVSATPLFEQAVCLRPEDALLRFQLGHSLFTLGRFDEAVKHLRRAQY